MTDLFLLSEAQRRLRKKSLAHRSAQATLAQLGVVAVSAAYGGIKSNSKRHGAWLELARLL